MVKVSSVSFISKAFSKLGDNSNSVVPMFVKDSISGGLTSLTYFKDGSKMDGREKLIEEYGTAVIWLGGIPFIKKIIDNTVYKKAGISPLVNAEKIFASGKENSYKTVEYAAKKASQLGENYKEQAFELTKIIEKKKLASGLSIGKFAISTAAVGFALYGLINLKQKLTEKKLKENLKAKYAQNQALKSALNKNDVYTNFKQKYQSNKPNSPSFKGGIIPFIMTNPIANTAIVDGVITSTRLHEARKGEKFEVGLREACQLAFIYGLAKPLQIGLEAIGKHVFKRPIDLDYSALNSDVLKNACENFKQNGADELFDQAKKVVDIIGKDKKIGERTAQKIIDHIFDPKNSKLANILMENRDVGIYKTKEGIEQLSLLSNINPNKIKTTASKTMDIIQNAAKSSDVAKYLKQTKFLKGAAIIGNILISGVLMGFVQPKLNIALRKKFNNGDSSNPAIKQVENDLTQKLMFEGNA